MKILILTLIALLTFSTFGISQTPSVVIDPALIEQAIEQALTSAKQLAIQEAEKKLQEIQTDAINKVSSSLKQTGILGDILNNQVKLLENARQFNSQLSTFNISSEMKNKGRVEVKKIVEKSDQISRTSKTLMEDEEIKGNDTQRLLLLQKMEEQQKNCESNLYGLRSRYEQSSNFNKSIDSISK